MDYTKLTKQELIETIETMEKDISKLKPENESLHLSNVSLEHQVNDSKTRVDQLRNESFEKQRKIAELEQNLNSKIENIKFLENQLNGLTDLFNEIYVGLKDQNALLGVYNRNINNFQERIDAKISKFNGTAPDNGEKQK